MGGRISELVVLLVDHWGWLILILISAGSLYGMVSRFLTVKPALGWRVLLFVTLGGTTGMVIWIGDNNLLFTLPVFFAVFLLCTRGNRLGRAAVTMIFFCMILSVSAMIDTYANQMNDWYDLFTRLVRPAVWGVLYPLVRRRLPEEPPRLPQRLWRLVAALAAMPMSALLAAVLVSHAWRYQSADAEMLARQMGLVLLPFVFLTALILLVTVRVLAHHEELEQARQLAGLREVYYQGLRREQEQVRALRHDLRNHLTVLEDCLERDDRERALCYLHEMAGAPALTGSRHFCENDTADAVLSAKAAAMEQRGVTPDFSVTLPRDLPLPDLDLCVLLGSTLDNAMEAAAGAEDKTVTLRAAADKGLFMLRCRNAYAGERRRENGRFPTTKSDPDAHGFGLQSMEQIAGKLGGTMDASAADGVFDLVICIPIGLRT